LREKLDCAVLMTPGHAAWVQDWVDSYRGQCGRLRFYAVDLESLAPGAPDMQLLACARLALRRFDCCVLPVATASLPWARTILVNTDAELPIPLMALSFDIAAPALLDLLSLGIADFIRAPVCFDELRARLVNLYRQMRLGANTMGIATARRAPFVEPSSRLSLDSDSRRKRGGCVREPWRDYGAITREPHASSIALTARSADESDAFDFGASVDEPFRQAKARIIDGFEQAYLRHALSRHSGNVAQAARASSKHRRAFWALMRKHQIDADHYRNHSPWPELPV